MDGIKGLDDGANADFGYRVQVYPQILDVMRPTETTALPIFAALMLLIFLFSALRRQWRTFLVCLIAGVLAIGLIEGTSRLVPRIGPTDEAGSYPAGSVFLCMLGFILLGVVIWNRFDARTLRCFYLAIAIAVIVWIAMGQLLLGRHYVTDVIGGICGAAFMGWGAAVFIRRCDSEQTLAEGNR